MLSFFFFFFFMHAGLFGRKEVYKVYKCSRVLSVCLTLLLNFFSVSIS